MSKFVQHRRYEGFTLIEALVTVSVAAVLLAVTVPSAIEWIRLNRLKASAAELVTDIQLARSETVRRNTQVFLAFRTSAAEKCYTVHTRTALGICDCLLGAGAACGSGAIAANRFELKTVSVPAVNGVSMTFNRSIYFNPPSAMPNGAATLQVDFDGGGSRQLRVVTNAAGRPQICTPSGSNVPGYAAC